MFDLRTHLLNAKGKLIKHQPYRLVIEDGKRLYERPKGSGFMYYENGELAKSPQAEKVKMDSKEAAKLAEAKAALEVKLEVKPEVKEVKEDVKAEVKK